MVNVGDWADSQSFGDEWNIFSLDILDEHDVLLCQEMESKVIGCVSHDRLLEKDDIDASLDDGLDQLCNIFSLFLQDSVHSSVVLNDDVVFHGCFWGGKVELAESDSWVFQAGWTASNTGDSSVWKDDTFEQLAVIDGTTDLLDDLNVSEVNVGIVLWIDDLFFEECGLGI